MLCCDGIIARPAKDGNEPEQSTGAWKGAIQQRRMRNGVAVVPPSGRVHRHLGSCCFNLFRSWFRYGSVLKTPNPNKQISQQARPAWQLHFPRFSSPKTKSVEPQKLKNFCSANRIYRKNNSQRKWKDNFKNMPSYSSVHIFSLCLSHLVHIALDI